MDDLIYRQDALRALSKQIVEDKIWARDASDAIVHLPSAEPEIIYCKDCKHYQIADGKAFGMTVRMCTYFHFEDMDEDDFCSRAERSTNE